jgi:hypothetical protein
MQITASGPGYAQLSHPWYPANKVRINRKPVAPLRGALDLLVVPIQAGANDIEIQPVTTPVRYYSAAASTAMLIVACSFAAIVAYGERRRKRHAGRSLIVGPVPR